MSNNDNNEMKIYVYRGNERVIIPEAVEKLIVQEGVQELPDGICFNYSHLRQVSLHPPPVKVVGTDAFQLCPSLIEVNLSTTFVTEIPAGAFCMCSSLQTVSLSKKIEFINHEAFMGCTELVTVVVPLDSNSMRIGQDCFENCAQLANLALPKCSDTNGEISSFDSCDRLSNKYSETTDSIETTDAIIAGLIRRFEDFPVHAICYDHSSTTAQALRQCIMDHPQVALIDIFQMTPFHILFSTPDPDLKFLQVLLSLLPNRILKCRDVNDKRPLDYLLYNWTDGTESLIRTTIQHWMIDPLSGWHDKWAKEMKHMVGELLCEHDKEQRWAILDEIYSLFEKYENVESTSILEMALWKCKIKSGSRMGAKRQARDRDECRCLSGSNIVIPHVVMFWIVNEEDCSDEDNTSEDEQSSAESSTSASSEEENSLEDEQSSAVSSADEED